MTTNKRNSAKDPYENSLMRIILSDASFEEKVRVVKLHNPYFYLLTPKPKKGKRNGV
jgi:hypothetical protein